MMIFMNEKVLSILEFHKIKDLLCAHVQSAPAMELARKLHPSFDLTEIERAQEQTGDALTRLYKSDSISFAGNSALKELTGILVKGGSLSLPDLLCIADSLECAGRVRAAGIDSDEEEKRDSLTDLFSQIDPLPEVKKELRRCILSPEEIADEASPELSRIRREMHLCEERMKERMSSYLSGSARSYLMEGVITMRDGHYCLPVKAEYKSQVPGIVHDQSASGSTFFIEPQAVVELAGKARALQSEEKDEIERILIRLSEFVTPYTHTLNVNEKSMTRLDFIFARGLLAMDMKASRPLMNTEHIIEIRKGRHPLISADKVVPIDVHLGDDFDLLVVTGPNTGGKTVSLKTVGLLTLMAQSGLHIPAGDRSRIALFKDVYADIGDEQSIEQNLSTFSAHMTSIVGILRNADADSLCLFDELCSGTDPTEGAALAISILEYLHQKGIRTMATTHYPELKLYALSHDRVENACCEFDVSTLSPTYKLLIGIPGKSNAFAISKKLGLPGDIIEAAREHITQDTENFEDVLANLEKSRISMEKDRLAMDQYKRESQSLKDQLKAKSEKLESSRDRILREANEEAKRIIEEAKALADESIREINAPSRDVKKLEKTRQKLGSEIKNKNEKLGGLSGLGKVSEVSGGVKAADLKIGMRVKILSMNLKGTVSTLPDNKGNLFVTCGIMRMQAAISDIMILPDEDSAAMYKSPASSGKKSSMKNSLSYGKSMSLSPEINLLGKTVDEAIAALDKYIDDACLAHLSSVRIVHGKGTGALRNAVHSHLKHLSVVESYRLGEYGEGDAGVTIAVLK